MKRENKLASQTRGYGGKKQKWESNHRQIVFKGRGGPLRGNNLVQLIFFDGERREGAV